FHVTGVQTCALPICPPTTSDCSSRGVEGPALRSPGNHLGRLAWLRAHAPRWLPCEAPATISARALVTRRGGRDRCQLRPGARSEIGRAPWREAERWA